MHLHITRDSVCAGDDIDPESNSRRLSINDGLSVEEIVGVACSAADLPTIVGGKATWCISSNKPLAIVAQQWPAPKFVSFIQPQLAELDLRDDGIWFHTSYFAQQDPDLVYSILRQLTLRAP